MYETYSQNGTCSITCLVWLKRSGKYLSVYSLKKIKSRKENISGPVQPHRKVGDEIRPHEKAIQCLRCYNSMTENF